MADAPRPRPERDVIPLHPDRPAPRRLRLPQLPPEVGALLRESGRKALGFFAPALFLAAGAFAKTLVASERDLVKAELDPYRVKRLGRRLTLRPDWEQRKLEVMETLVREKFTRHAHLAALLLSTGSIELVERNHWRDTFWGVCGGTGQNHLGRILMKVRAELRGA